MMLFVAAMASEVSAIPKEKKSDHDLIITGVGKVNAAATLSRYLSSHTVDCIVNLGFAGATHPYQVGDLVIIEEASYHDFNLTMFGYEKGQVPGMPPQFHSDSKLKQHLKSRIMHAKTGILYTGDVFMTEIQPGRFLVDMEGAALYHVAHMHQIPIISVKVVSDVIGSEKHIEQYQQFEEHQGAQALLKVYQMLV
jgi:adenosylhomocysteine nucleosidase